MQKNIKIQKEGAVKSHDDTAECEKTILLLASKRETIFQNGHSCLSLSIYGA